jgi:hypothetical protein
MGILMASVVIIHAKEDALPARALSEKLRAAGFAPLTEQSGKESFHQAIRDAAVVVALWSPRSVIEPDLVDDAVFAQDIGPVLHARMQNAPNPAPFANEDSIDLTGWRGEDDFATWRTLLKTVAQRAGVPEPVVQARSASPFFQPGPATAPAPAQRSAAVHTMPARAATPRQTPAHLAAEALSEERLAPIRPLSEVSRSDYARPDFRESESREPREPKSSGGGGKLALIGSVTFLVVAAVGLGGYFAYDRFQAGQSADAAWSQLDARDPSDLQTFLERHDGSSHASEARRRLNALDQEAYGHARSADTIEAFQRYLSDFPESENALAARGRIAELRQMPTPAAELAPAIDPVTGLPIDPTAPPPSNNPDLLPPGMGDFGGPPVESTEGGGPVPLAPAPTNAPAAAPAPQPAPIQAPN